MKPFITVLLILISAITVKVSAQQKNVTINQPVDEVYLKPSFNQLSYLPCGDTILTVDKALAAFTNHKFIINQRAEINLGIARDDYWIHFNVTNTTSNAADLALVLQNARINEVEVYQLKNNQSISTFKTGDHTFFSSRPIDYNEFAFPLVLQANETVPVFLLVKHKGSSLQLPILIQSKNKFLARVPHQYFSFGIRMGIMVIVFSFALFLFLTNRSYQYFFYGINILVSCLWVFTTEGYGFQFVWPHFPGFNNRLEAGFGVLYSATFALNALYFTKPYDSRGKLRSVLTWFGYFFLVWGIIPLLPFVPLSNGPSAFIFLYSFFGLEIIAIFLMAIYLLKLILKGHTIILYYFIAVVLTLVFALMVAGYNLGFIVLPFSSGAAVSIGVIADAVLMTLGIARQFYLYKKEKENMYVEYIRQQQSINQQIISTQDAERKRISAELHDDLGSGLTQIIMINEHARHQAEKGKQTIEELKDISITSRQLVEKVNEIIWTMSPENNSLESLIVYLRDLVHKTLEYSHKEYTVQLPEITGDIKLTNEQRRNIILLLKESMNNALKYSNANTITIIGTIENRWLTLLVKDDGIGFDITEKRKGNGLKHYHQRTALLRGRTEIISAVNNGTTVTFYIPLSANE